jgi:GTP-binding protein
MSEDEKYTQDELEAGRLLFAKPWDFITSVTDMANLPPADRTEIAFAGRSNVGKSSLINALTGRKGLARTSSTPGRTQMLNIFSAPDTALTIVDMPGYGYAQAPKELVEAWTELVFAYLRGRPTLRRVFLLIDSRHGLKKNDLETMDLLDKAAVIYQVVLTKSDKIKPGQLTRLMDQTSAALSKRPAAFPEIVATSSEKGAGLDELRAEINRLVSY